MRSLDELNEHVDEFEENTLAALEGIVEGHLPKIAATGVANKMLLTTLQERVDALTRRIAALEEGRVAEE